VDLMAKIILGFVDIQYLFFVKKQYKMVVAPGQTHLNPNTWRTLHDGVSLFTTD
jgi:hypothetical protein